MSQAPGSGRGRRLRDQLWSWSVLALLAVLPLAACGGGSPAAPAPSPTPTPPPANIVLIMADDLEAQSLEYMPKLKSLVTDRGLKLANSFATTPLCCPSRASLLTGQYAHNHGVLSNGPPRGGFGVFRDEGRENSTIATWLKAAGYRTALFGKYLNQYPAGTTETYVPPGWDEWFGVLEDRRAELALYTMNENGKIVLYSGRSTTEYQTDVLSNKAVDFIRRAEANDAQPFFIWMGVAAPHLPAIPSDKYVHELGGLSAPRTAGFNEDDVSDKPRYLRQTPRLTEDDAEEIDDEYRDRQLTLMSVDDMVQAIVQVLEQTGELENTYLLFTSDNGIFQGQHRLKGKSAPYEEAIRVPLMVRGPGVPAGRSSDLLVTNIDLAPTFAAWARASAPDSVDGRSLTSVFGASPPSPENWRRDFLIEFLAADGGSDGALRTGLFVGPGSAQAAALLARGMPDYVGLRTETQSYVEYASGETELYDLTRDGDQLDNQTTTGAADPAAMGRLAARLAAIKGCKGAACRQ